MGDLPLRQRHRATAQGAGQQGADGHRRPGGAGPAHPGGPDFLLEAVDELSAAEQAAFLRALVTMIRTLQVRGRIPVARMCVSCRFFQPHRHDHPTTPHHCAFVDAPFGDGQLRLDCPDHLTAPEALAARNWEAFHAPAATDPGRTP